MAPRAVAPLALAGDSLVVALIAGAVKPVTVAMRVVIVFIPMDLVPRLAVPGTDTISAGLGCLELFLGVVVAVSLIP